MLNDKSNETKQHRWGDGGLMFLFIPWTHQPCDSAMIVQLGRTKWDWDCTHPEIYERSLWQADPGAGLGSPTS